ncbi:hemagglutinin repeat-containing protein [Yersinia thracica]|uniref:hemagglutinin repeat-containing protein n=1 Tax=Yersinia thracica TaxID=2890319 RepID=UPI00157DFE59|nr:hemagglutinin repeat-containing protein [Yersinia thracica]
MQSKKFTLSAGGKLAVLISMTLAPVSISYAAGIQAAGDAANRPEISSMSNGAELINIAPPSESGLSHNKYQDFNVGKLGAVFNNSTQDTHFNGENITANSNLSKGGRGADLILNEVISSNPSTLLGHQSLVGTNADYILANPNGITCDGCSFDPNFNRVTLGSGKVITSDGNFNNIYSRAGDRHIVIKNTDDKDNISKVLHILAPSVQIDSHIRAKESVDITLGVNAIDSDGNIITSSFSNGADYTIDAASLGSMTADRIRVFDSLRNRTMTISKNINAASSLGIKTLGGLDITANELKGDDGINIKGGSINIKSDEVSLEKPPITQLIGSNVSIEADKDIHLTSIHINHNRGDLLIKGEKISMDAHIRKETQYSVDIDRDNIKSSDEGIKLKVHRNVLTGSNVSLVTTSDDLALTSVKISATDGLTLDSAKDLKVSGLQQADTYEKDIKYTASGDDVRDGKKISRSEYSTLVATEFLSDDNINITSGRDILLNGARISADKQLSIKAGGNIDINAQKTLDRHSTDLKYSQWGGIAGSEKDDTVKSQSINHISRLSGSDVNISTNGDIRVIASEISTTGGGNIISGGNLIFSGVLNDEKLKSDISTGGALDITTSTDEKNNSYEQFIDSKLTSGLDFNLVGNRIITDGSQFDIGGDLRIKSKTGVSITAAQQQQKIDEERTRLSLDFYTKEVSKDQYNAGFMIKHAKDTEVGSKNEQHVATMTARGIFINSGQGDIELYGAALKTTASDISLRSGQNIGLFAARNSNATDKTTKITSGGAYYTGGINKFGNGVNVNVNNGGKHLTTDTSIVSRLDSAKDIRIYAHGDITQQGAQHVAAGEYWAEGRNITNLASHNSSFGKTAKEDISGGFGFNIDYSGITRPIKKALKNDIAKNGVVIPNLKLPTAGVDITAKGSQTDKSTDSTAAFVTSIRTGGEIKLRANDTFIDEGTQYQSGKLIKFHAKNYFNKSAINSEKDNERKLSGEGGLRVATSTGKDIKISAKGEGGGYKNGFYTHEALPSVFQSASGVKIDITDSGYFQATQIEGGTGDVVITAGDKLHFDQAASSGGKNGQHDYGKGGFKLGLKPGSQSLAVEGKGHTEQKNSFYNNAIKSSMTTLANVRLSAGNGDLILTGTKIGNEDKLVGNVKLSSGNNIKLLASVSDSATREDKAGGSLVLSVSKANSNDNSTTEGGIGFSAEKKRVKESTLFSEGTTIYSGGNVAISAKSDNKEAIYAQGLQIKARQVDITTANGGILLESAQSQAPKDNIDFFISASGSGSTTSGSNTDIPTENKLTGGSFNIKDDKSNQWVIKHQNSRINAEHGLLKSGKDMLLKGAKVVVDSLRADIGGNLHIQSVKEFELIDNKDFRFNLSYMGTTDLAGDEMAEFGGSGSNMNTNKQGITEMSGIYGQNNVVINHYGTKRLANAKVVNANKPVEWNKFTVNPLKPTVVVEEKEPKPNNEKLAPDYLYMLPQVY